MPGFFADYADEYGAIVIYLAVSDGVEFHDVMRPYLEQIPEECCAPGVKGRIAAEIARATLTPSVVADLLSYVKYSQIVFIFDEFDRLVNDSTKSQLATLMKMTSDARLNVNFLIVGIADNVRDLVGVHASLSRHLTVAMVEPLANFAVELILQHCLDSVRLEVDRRAAAMLVSACCGSPYHVRLFGMHSALMAIADGERRVSCEHVVAGLEAAFNEWRTCNPHDAKLFERIAKDCGDDFDGIIRFAEYSAYHHAGAEIADEEMGPIEAALDGSGKFFSMLEPAIAVSGKAGRATFHDSTAPQFLAVAMKKTRATATPEVASKDQAVD